MAFRRIEYILIAAFLLLNAFLFHTIYEQNYSSNRDNKLRQGISRSIETEMQAAEISFGDLSKDVQKLPFMVGVFDDGLGEHANERADQELRVGNNDRLYSRLKNPLELPGLTANTTAQAFAQQPLETLKQYLSSSAMRHGEEYDFAFYNANKKMIVFYQLGVDKHHIVDGSGEVIFHLDDNYRVTSYEQAHVENIQAQGESRTLISEKQALENLFLYNELPNHSEVLSASLGYRTNLLVKDLLIYKPVWMVYIRDKDGNLKTLYVDAINGTIIQASSS